MNMNIEPYDFNSEVASHMTTEELAIKVLFSIKETLRGKYNYDLNFASFRVYFERLLTRDPAQAGHNRHDYFRAFAEAWAWLEVNLFLVQGLPPEGVRSPDYRKLSRLAESFSEEADVTSYMIARRFSKALLHDKIAGRSWKAFERGEYDSAILQAMKAVEIEVRSVSGLGDRDGVNLISSAFAPQKDNKPDCGPLTDKEVNTAEQIGRLQLFAGTYSSYRNPAAHRDFSIDSPEEAIEILMIASHLLRIIDVRKAAIAQERSVRSVSV